jgi:hypothetical protein
MLAHTKASRKTSHVAINANEYGLSRKGSHTNELVDGLFWQRVAMIDHLVTVLKKYVAYRIGNMHQGTHEAVGVPLSRSRVVINGGANVLFGQRGILSFYLFNRISSVSKRLDASYRDSCTSNHRLILYDIPLTLDLADR